MASLPPGNLKQYQTPLRTNIDVRWATTDGTHTFCEVKLSESELGKAPDDDRHRRKLHDTYRPRLVDHLAPSLLEPARFFAAYQFARNVWHVVGTPGSRLVFLVPSSNERIWAALQELLLLVSTPTRRRITPVSIENLLATLRADPRCPQLLRKHANALATKYTIERAT